MGTFIRPKFPHPPGRSFFFPCNKYICTGVKLSHGHTHGVEINHPTLKSAWCPSVGATALPIDPPPPPPRLQPFHCNRKSAGGMHLETLDGVLGRSGGGPGGEEETRLFLLRKSFFFKTRWDNPMVRACVFLIEKILTNELICSIDVFLGKRFWLRQFLAKRGHLS